MDTTNGLDEETVFKYLEELRASGVTNMYASPRFLQAHFGISEDIAIEWFSLWAKSFNKFDQPYTAKEAIEGLEL